MEDSTRVLDSQSFRGHHLSQQEFKEVVRIFNTYRRTQDPLCGVAKKCSVLPVKVAATLAMTRGYKQLLTALGQPVPEEWERLARQQVHDAADEVDLVLDEQVAADQSEDLIESIHTVIQNELAEDFEELNATAEDEENLNSHSYSLTPAEQSQLLVKQLDQFRKHRTAILNSAREGSRVMPVTADGNVTNLLRFLGWCKRHGNVSEPLDMRIFGHEDARQLLDTYVEWLAGERKISMGSVANYVNGLMQIMSYIAAEMLGGEALPSVIRQPSPSYQDGTVRFTFALASTGFGAFR